VYRFLHKVLEEGFVIGFVQARTLDFGVWCVFRFCFTRFCTVFCIGCVWDFVYRFLYNVWNGFAEDCCICFCIGFCGGFSYRPLTFLFIFRGDRIVVSCSFVHSLSCRVFLRGLA